MKIRKPIAAVTTAALLALTAACGVSSSDSDTSSAGSSTSQTSDRGDGPGGGGGPGNSVDVSSVSTEEELIALVQEAYGDGGLDLHRGHQPVQDVLDEVLEISHDELHVRMEEQSQNLAAVAEDIGVNPQTLIDALVDSWSPAVDNAVESGAITEAEAEGYLAALEDAFTFRVTWDGEEEMPTFSGV